MQTNNANIVVIDSFENFKSLKATLEEKAVRREEPVLLNFTLKVRAELQELKREVLSDETPIQWCNWHNEWNGDGFCELRLAPKVDANDNYYVHICPHVAVNRGGVDKCDTCKNEKAWLFKLVAPKSSRKTHLIRLNSTFSQIEECNKRVCLAESLAPAPASVSMEEEEELPPNLDPITNNVEQSPNHQEVTSNDSAQDLTAPVSSFSDDILEQDPSQLFLETPSFSSCQTPLHHPNELYPEETSEVSTMPNPKSSMNGATLVHDPYKAGPQTLSFSAVAEEEGEKKRDIDESMQTVAKGMQNLGIMAGRIPGNATSAAATDAPNTDRETEPRRDVVSKQITNGKFGRKMLPVDQQKAIVQERHSVNGTSRPLTPAQTTGAATTRRTTRVSRTTLSDRMQSSPDLLSDSIHVRTATADRKFSTLVQILRRTTVPELVMEILKAFVEGLECDPMQVFSQVRGSDLVDELHSVTCKFTSFQIFYSCTKLSFDLVDKDTSPHRQLTIDRLRANEIDSAIINNFERYSEEMRRQTTPVFSHLCIWFNAISHLTRDVIELSMDNCSLLFGLFYSTRDVHSEVYIIDASFLGTLCCLCYSPINVNNIVRQDLCTLLFSCLERWGTDESISLKICAIIAFACGCSIDFLRELRSNNPGALRKVEGCHNNYYKNMAVRFLI